MPLFKHAAPGHGIILARPFGHFMGGCSFKVPIPLRTTMLLYRCAVPGYGIILAKGLGTSRVVVHLQSDSLRSTMPLYRQAAPVPFLHSLMVSELGGKEKLCNTAPSLSRWHFGTKPKGKHQPQPYSEEATPFSGLTRPHH